MVALKRCRRAHPPGMDLDAEGRHRIRRQMGKRPDGKPNRVVRYEWDHDEALRVHRRIFASGRRRAGALRSMTLAEYAVDLLDRNPREWTPNTVRTYGTALKMQMRPYPLAHRKLAHLTEDDVRDWVEAMRTAGVGVPSVNRAIKALKTILREAEEERLLDVANPAERIRLLKDKRVEPDVLDPDLAGAFCRWADEADPDYAALYWLLATTGVRINEALGLRWADLDLEMERVAFLRGQAFQGRRLPWVKGRSEGDAPKEATLPLVAVEKLRRHKARQAERRVAAGRHWVDEDLVFPTRHGRVMRDHHVRVHMAEAAERSGIMDEYRRRAHNPMPRLHPHAFRTMAVSALHNDGEVHPQSVAKLIGHSPQVSETHYYRLDAPVRRKASDRLAALVTPPPPRAARA